MARRGFGGFSHSAGHGDRITNQHIFIEFARFRGRRVVSGTRSHKGLSPTSNAIHFFTKSQQFCLASLVRPPEASALRQSAFVYINFWVYRCLFSHRENLPRQDRGMPGFPMMLVLHYVRAVPLFHEHAFFPSA